MSFLVFPLLIWAGVHMEWWLIVLAFIFIYARWVEPWWIVLREYNMGAAHARWPRIAVLADLHLGIFKGRRFLQRVVKMVNDLEVDLVLLPGDFVYAARDLSILNGLKEVRAPMYGVLGNHDLKPSGEFEKREIVAALEKVGVRMIDNKTVDGIAGVGSVWVGDDSYEHLKKREKILMVHNPDAVDKLPKDLKVDLIVCGHTHGGQMRIPWLYKKVIPCKGAWDCGLYEVKQGKLLISGGLGEVVLPMRLGMRPEILVIS